MRESLKKEIQLMIDELGSGESFSILTSDNDEWEIGASDCWLGGYFEGDEVGCDYLGNIIYTKDSILEVLISEGLDIVEIIY